MSFAKLIITYDNMTVVLSIIIEYYSEYIVDSIILLCTCLNCLNHCLLVMWHIGCVVKLCSMCSNCIGNLPLCRGFHLFICIRLSKGGRLCVCVRVCMHLSACMCAVVFNCNY